MKILITAGATWVKVDEVRVLTTLFTGKTGLILAKALAKRGHKVTLLINPHCFSGLAVAPKIKVETFRYFSELELVLAKQLRVCRFDAIIHSAAVSDYLLERPYAGKIPSGKSKLNLKLIAAPKLIKMIRKISPQIKLIQFKLEVERAGLLEKAQAALIENKSDAVVANAYRDLEKKYLAFFVTANQTIKLNSLNQLSREIERFIAR